MPAHDPNQSEAAEPRKQRVSERQLAANRANEQKSTGAKTDAGKLRSRANSITHGLTARVVCLPGEGAEQYNGCLQDFMDLQPRNIAECDIVRNLVAALARKERAIRYEHVALVEKQTVNRAEIDRLFQAIGVEAETAVALKVLSVKSNVLGQLDRYETRIDRRIESCWRQLERSPQHPAASSGPSDRDQPMTTEHELTTDNRQLTTKPTTASPPATRHSPLVKAAA